MCQIGCKTCCHMPGSCSCKTLPTLSRSASICLVLPWIIPEETCLVLPQCFHLGMFGVPALQRTSHLRHCKQPTNPILTVPSTWARLCRDPSVEHASHKKKRTNRILWMTVQYLLWIHFTSLVQPCEIHLFLLLLDVSLLDCTSMYEMWKPNLDTFMFLILMESNGNVKVSFDFFFCPGVRVSYEYLKSGRMRRQGWSPVAQEEIWKIQKKHMKNHIICIKSSSCIRSHQIFNVVTFGSTFPSHSISKSTPTSQFQFLSCHNVNANFTQDIQHLPQQLKTRQIGQVRYSTFDPEQEKDKIV
jgi:hypothetical protein